MFSSVLLFLGREEITLDFNKTGKHVKAVRVTTKIHRLSEKGKRTSKKEQG